MVKHTKGFKGLSKKVLSAILAASMIMTSSSFVMAAEEPVNSNTAIATESEASVVSEEPKANDGEVGSIAVDESNITVTNPTYNGHAQKPGLEIKVSEKTLTEGEDYQITGWSNNVNAGDYTARVQFMGVYSENSGIDVKYSIQPLDISDAVVDWDDINNRFVYNQQEQYPEIYSVTKSVTVDGEEETLSLSANDYEFDVQKGSVKDASDEVVVALVGKGNYMGTTNINNKLRYAIEKAPLNSDMVSVNVGPVLYSSNAGKLRDNVKKAISIEETITGDTLSADDFTIQYRNEDGEWSNTPMHKLGTQTLRITPTDSCGNYAVGEYIEANFEVVSENTLQTLADKAVVSGFESKDEDGVRYAIYNGTDQFVDSVEIDDLNRNDFKISTAKAEWINAGEYTIELEGLGKYAGQTATIPVKIVPMSLVKDNGTAASGVRLEASRGTHSNDEVGDAFVVLSTVVNGKRVTLEEGVDYTYEVEEESNGEFTVKVTGIGNFSTKYKDGTTLDKADNETTEKLDLADPSIVAEVTKTFESGAVPNVEEEDIHVVETYNGNEIRELDPNEDYYVSIQPKGNHGEVTVTITARNGSEYYSGSKEISFTLVGTSFADTFNLASIDDVEKGTDLSDVKKDIKVTYQKGGASYSKIKWTIYNAEGDEVATNDTGTYSFDEVGTYTLKVESTEATKFDGSLETTFNVIGDDLQDKKAEISAIDDQVYTGEEIKPAVTVKIGDKVLKADEDYTVAYSNNVNVGSADVVVTGINEYSGTLSTTFDITKGQQTIEMTNPLQVRDLGNGSRATNSKNCTLKLGFGLEDKVNLSYSSDNEDVATVSNGVITYQGVGECTITVTAKETDNCLEYSLPIKVVVGKVGTPTFTPSVTSKTAKKSITVTSSTVRGADGFEVQYSIRSDWWRASTVDFDGTTNGKLYRQTIKTYHSNKKYYIRVRAYQVVDGAKVYSDWSPAKTATTK